MNKGEKIKFVTKDGKEVTGDILLTFDDNVTDTCYVVYTDYAETDDGEIQIYASTYEPSDEMINLKPIETEEEWKLINFIIDHVRDRLKKGSLPDDN